MHQHFASDLVPTEASLLLAAAQLLLAGEAAHAADAHPALAGAPECLSHGEGVLLGWVSCVGLQGGGSR